MRLSLLLLFLAMGCLPRPSEEAASDKVTKARVQLAAASPLKGEINNKPWQFAKGLAYRSDQDSSSLILGLFSADGATGCSITSEGVFHSYPDEESSNYASLSISLPVDINSLPWSNSQASIGVSSSMESSSLIGSIKITGFSDSKIAGVINGSNNSSSVEGAFTAEYCQGEPN